MDRRDVGRPCRRADERDEALVFAVGNIGRDVEQGSHVAHVDWGSRCFGASPTGNRGVESLGVILTGETHRGSSVGEKSRGSRNCVSLSRHEGVRSRPQSQSLTPKGNGRG